jgi:hypothetical protein
MRLQQLDVSLYTQDRESLAVVIHHLETTRQNLVDLLAEGVGSEKAKRKTRETLARIDVELPGLSTELERESVFS